MNKHIVKLFSSLMLVAGFAAVAPRSAQAQPLNCQPYEIMELRDRIHVRCSNTLAVTDGGNASITYLAISNSNAAVAARFVALANAALIGNKSFRVDITYGGARVAGCDADNCRTPTAFGVRE